MGTPVRVNEDNYIRLKQEADETGRSATNMLNRILDTRYGRGTEGNLTQYPVSQGTPTQITGVPPKIEDVKTFVKQGQDAQKAAEKIISEANASGVSELFDNEHLELSCCQNEFRPCNHWVWDVQTGEGYRNSLSGRYREAE